MKLYLTLLIIAMSLECLGQDKVIYHDYYHTASSFKITKWNIDKDSLSRMYVKETIDSMNRTSALEYYVDGKVVSDYLAYLVPIVKYQYVGDTIIELNYNSNGSPVTSLETELPYKSVYVIKDSKIASCQNYYDYTDKQKKEYSDIEDFLLINAEASHDCTCIGSYFNAYSKLNGQFPIGTKFDIKMFIPSGVAYQTLVELLERSNH